MANAALTQECSDHFKFKEITESVNIFYKLKGYDIRVTTEEARDGYIPDVCFYDVKTEKLLGVLEVVNYNRLNYGKINTYKNMNQYLWYVDILPWTLRYLDIAFSLWEPEFSAYFKKALEGIENADFIRTASEANAKRIAFFDGIQANLVRYDVREINERYGFYDVIGYELSGKSYHMFFVGEIGERYHKEILNKEIQDYRISDEPIYKVFSEHACWIDALNVPKHLTQLV